MGAGRVRFSEMSSLAFCVLGGNLKMKDASKCKKRRLRWLRDVSGQRVGLILPSMPAAR